MGRRLIRISQQLVLMAVVLMGSAAAHAEGAHPYFENNCNAGLRGHQPMEVVDIQVEASYLQAEIARAVGPEFSVKYDLYHRRFPNLYKAIEKRPGFHWVDTFGRQGSVGYFFLDGIRNKNANRTRRRETLALEGVSAEEIENTVGPIHGTPSLTFFTPIRWTHRSGYQLTRNWFKDDSRETIHRYVGPVSPTEYSSELWMPANMVTDYQGILEQFLDLKSNFEVVFDLLDVQGEAMFTLSEERTTFVDKDGNDLALEDILQKISGAELVPWSWGEPENDVWWMRKTSEAVAVPRFNLIWLEGSNHLPRRVYEVRFD